MLTVKLDKFRCFGDSPPIEIRPITFLVGENSAGKTSFLAGVRFLLECLSRQSQNSFNIEPYFLGGFEQIAHYRGGRDGRAKRFTLSLTTDDRIGPSGKRTRVEPATHRFSFIKGSPQPELESYSFRLGDGEQDGFDIQLSSSTPKLSFLFGGEQKLFSQLKDRFPPTNLIRDNMRFITHVIDIAEFDRVTSKEASSEAAGFDFSTKRTDINRIHRTYRDSAFSLSQDVFASAPVRTEPRRTYNPSEIVSSSEGSHVPLELARAKLRAPETWKSIQQRLVEFGNDSGLFSDIDIRQLGKSDIDPFQILVKINGPAMNLVDVGYGISQVLPIVYQMQNSAKYKAFLLQQPEVHLHPKAQAELGSLLVKTVLGVNKPTMIVETHSDYMIDRVGYEIARSTISKEDVTVIFFERQQHASVAMNLNFNEAGELANPPVQFRSFFLEERARILGLL